MSELDKIFNSKKEKNIFLYKISAVLQHVGENGNKMNISISNPYTIINANRDVKAPIWIIVISIISGILVFVLVTFILYKLGFFKRKKKEEIKNFRRESRRMTMRIQEAALLKEENIEVPLEDEVFTNNCNEMVKQLQATQKLKKIEPNEDIVEEDNQRRTSHTRMSQSRVSYKVVSSITLKENEG